MIRALTVLLVLLLSSWAEASHYITPPGVTCANDPRLTAPVTGQDYCFESTTQRLLTWTGSVWIPTLINTTGTTGSYSVTGLVGQNNAGTPNTKFDFSADQVTLRNPSDQSVVVRINTGTLTNDTGVAGSTANGRDQSGAFSASSWVHLYFIWNGSTLATLSSATAPPTGPSFPSGYTHWAYVGAIRFDGSANFLKAHLRGAQAFYQTEQAALSNGSATSETSVSVSALVPPNALHYGLDVNAAGTASASGQFINTIILRVVTGLTTRSLSATSQGLAANSPAGAYSYSDVVLPNVSQTFFYFNSLSVGTAQSVNASVVWYRVPNGGE